MKDKQKTTVIQQESETNLADNSISKLSHFSSDEEFEKVKAYPVNRTFNSFMALMVVIISIGLGVLIGCLILLFC